MKTLKCLFKTIAIIPFVFIFAMFVVSLSPLLCLGGFALLAGCTTGPGFDGIVDGLLAPGLRFFEWYREL